MMLAVVDEYTCWAQGALSAPGGSVRLEADLLKSSLEVSRLGICALLLNLTALAATAALLAPLAGQAPFVFALCFIGHG